MPWRELLDMLEPLIPVIGVAGVVLAIALLILAVTGSLAAIEVAKFYRRQNRALEEVERRDALSVTEQELRGTLRTAVAEAVEPLRQELGDVRTQLREPARVPASG